MLSTLTGLALDFEYTTLGRTLKYTVISETENTVMTKSGTGSRQPGNDVTGNLVIPSSVTYNGKSYKVISIGSYSFSGSDITSVKFPFSVTTIGEGAFKYCSSLATVTLSNSVSSIGKYAFDACFGLTSISIPSSVTSIESYAFDSCYNLAKAEFASIESLCKIEFGGSNSNPIGCAHNLWIAGEEIKDLVIPEGITSIGNSQFAGCQGLTSVKIPSSVIKIGRNVFNGCLGLTKAEFASIESLCNIQFEYWDSNPIAFSRNLWIAGEEIKELIIPDDVTSIPNFAFHLCDSLISVTIGEAVTSIGREAFASCYNLTSLSISSSVTSMGESAFSNCSNLTKVEFASLESLCGIRFSSSSNPLNNSHNLWIAGEEIKDLVIPESVTSIGNSAFEGCSGLTSVTFGNHVTNIGECAFEDCTGLTSIEIPNSITDISRRAFRGCSGLTSVTLPNTIINIGLGAFHACTGLTSITIPNSVRSIGDNAFNGCSGLTNVTLGSFPATIKEWTFSGCNSLRTIKCRSVTPPAARVDSFDESTYLSCELLVPDQSMDDYRNHFVWERFLNISPAGVETLSMEKGNDISVYMLSGQMLYNNVDPETVYTLSPGTYIILQGGETKKILVK